MMITVKQQIDHWRESAASGLETMTVLFDGKRYSDALFFGHIVL